jgi:carboxymethylenebutenolidase
MKAKWFGLLLVLVSLAALPGMAFAQSDVQKGDIDVTSGGKVYKSYLAAPSSGGPYPGIILIHSFRGLEEGYKTMVDQLAGEGFVVLAAGWQTFEQSPSDAVVKQLVEDSIKLLSERQDVDKERLGLTGFCAGGRYTMLYMPQIAALKAGVAWYGFPNRGEPAPAALVKDLKAPMLIIHGTEDQPSPIGDIYKYADALRSAKAYFELKVYYGEPHGFMLAGGKLRQDEVAVDAYREMADFFKRKLAAETK